MERKDHSHCLLYVLGIAPARSSRRYACVRRECACVCGRGVRAAIGHCPSSSSKRRKVCVCEAWVCVCEAWVCVRAWFVCVRACVVCVCADIFPARSSRRYACVRRLCAGVGMRAAIGHCPSSKRRQVCVREAWVCVRAWCVVETKLQSSHPGSPRSSGRGQTSCHSDRAAQTSRKQISTSKDFCAVGENVRPLRPQNQT